jgi:predicted cupin superfamily sugar epimerase
MKRIQEIITKYQLQPHPEGGYFREVYRSEQMLNSPIHNEYRNAVTHIYFLLAKGQISRFHKVHHDEIWNFYEGSPLKLIEFDGNEIQKSIIGDQDYFKVIKGGVFQAAESLGDYSLVGCSVAPGFDFKDFSFMTGESSLIKIFEGNYPQFMRFV